MSFSGKVALITGASSGIGLAIARALYNEGYSIAVTGRSLERLEQTYTGLDFKRILCIEADATDINSYAMIVEKTVNRFNRLDVLVNNVGGGTLGKTLKATTMYDFTREMNLNLTSVFFTSQAALPYIVEAKGTIINFSSIL